MSRPAQALPTAARPPPFRLQPENGADVWDRLLAASHLSPPGSPRVSSLGAALSGSLETGAAHSPQGRGVGDLQHASAQTSRGCLHGQATPTGARAACFSHALKSPSWNSQSFLHHPYFHSALGPGTFRAALLTWRCQVMLEDTRRVLTEVFTLQSAASFKQTHFVLKTHRVS